MAQDTPELAAHKEWLGQIQQVGLVVSPHVLVRHGVFVDRVKAVEVQTKLGELGIAPKEARSEDGRASTALEFPAFAAAVLDWPANVLAGAPGGPPLPADLLVALPEHEDTLSPTFALPDLEQPDAPPLALVVAEPAGTDFDALPAQGTPGWRATPHARLERLLRETKVPVGLLWNGAQVRLVYAPSGESSGHLTFRLLDLVQTLGRPMAGALYALLGSVRVLDVLPEDQRLPALLRESRKYQNEVSTELAEQVLEALWELVRGFDRANSEMQGQLLGEFLREQPDEVYGGLLTTLMRLVFVLYAEDRGLMPAGETYQKHYAVAGLFERLREDAARYPDTMDARYGAWAQLLSLFRLIHDGCGHGDLRFPARHGRLFDPDAYPFLEGRPHGSRRTAGEVLDTPRVSDGVVYRVLRNLLILDGERLSYRALDVEQIGSVYESMMGFALRHADAPAIAVAPKHIVVSLTDLLAQKPKDRNTWLKTQAEAKVTGDALAKATTADEVVAALGRKASRYTPHVLPAGALYLQPTEERRRSGSHYTPRSLTAPIVKTTLRPIFERLGDQATPEQVLGLKVCDPAMGSGAFLVEACRLLGERLVKAWEVHRRTPTDVPDNEDLVTYARRLVAERCLYGVDRNVFAVDLAKLSLWLATLAREHPFTFLDHALRHGDSLVGLSREQIACFNWETGQQLPLLRSLIDERVAAAQALRLRIQGMGASDDVPEKARLLRDAEAAVADVRRLGDLVIAAFFEREKPKDRKALLTAYFGLAQNWLSETGPLPEPEWDADAGDQGRVTFHWEVEFPEVFARSNGGFDVIAGNPPFMGGSKISSVLGSGFLDWLLCQHPGSHGNGDLVAHFLRRSFLLCRAEGTLGLIASNSVAQGDTRTTGLEWIRRHDGQIFEARKRVRWDGAAAVVVSIICVKKGAFPTAISLDGKRVSRITAFLLAAGPDVPPARLTGLNASYYSGSKVNGEGFLMTPDEAAGIVAAHPESAEVLHLYLDGSGLNDSPDLKPKRMIVCFGERSYEECVAQWPNLVQRLEQTVKPQRAGNARRLVRERWWQFEHYRHELYQHVERMRRVLAIATHSSTFALAFLSPPLVFSHALAVLPLDSMRAFCVLQSRVHEEWARYFGSSLKDDLRYTPSDCFETFPFPRGWEGDDQVDQAGREYYECRAAIMVRHSEGLTKTYNRFHDPDEHEPGIVRLRELHAAMDRAVLDAYGWTDLQPECELLLDYEDEDDGDSGGPTRHRKPWRLRWADSVRDEVMGRLLALNAERARGG